MCASDDDSNSRTNRTQRSVNSSLANTPHQQEVSSPAARLNRNASHCLQDRSNTGLELKHRTIQHKYAESSSLIRAGATSACAFFHALNHKKRAVAKARPLISSPCIQYGVDEAFRRRARHFGPEDGRFTAIESLPKEAARTPWDLVKRASNGQDLAIKANEGLQHDLEILKKTSKRLRIYKRDNWGVFRGKERSSGRFAPSRSLANQ